MPIAYVIPGDKEVGTAVNRGSIRDVQLALARSEGHQGLAAPAAPASSGAPAGSEAKAAKQGKAVSAPRTSLFKAGKSKLAKPKAKKAA